ncbi:MAG: hypothetical protein ED559_04390 [Phycisphaera sp.]|nr:MAG: hypothetical protein ED559_04390 [Phycisphaera sp.]
MTGRCAATGDELAPGETMVVVLLDRPEDEELDRLDFSLDAWNEGARPESGRHVFATWKTEVPEPGKKQDALISADGMADLFEQLEGTEDQRRLAFRYVLALMLMRKRLLEYVGTEGNDLLVLPKGAEEGTEPTRVHDPQAAGELDEAALTQLAEQVEQVLDNTDG